MNYLVLANGKEFAYANAIFSREQKSLDFEFASGTDYMEVFNTFSEVGEDFDVEAINILTLKDEEGNVLGTWEGFNSLTNIENKLMFNYDNTGNKITSAQVRISLQKETISDEFKRVKEAEIAELKEMNMMLMLALAESAEQSQDGKQTLEVALAELVEILVERRVI